MELQKTNSYSNENSLTVVKKEFTTEQVALIKSQVAPKATDNELKLFLYQCTRTGLDPLTRQIYAIHRRSGNEEKMTIQTSIDGFRVIAERSGLYAGQSEPVFVYKNDTLQCCKISVFKFNNGQRYEAAVGVAFWDEYVITKDEWINGKKTGKKMVSDMWAKMPHTMLSKVAEALALRKAFPQDLSGLYTGDEMQQADKPQDVNVDIDAEISDVPTKDERKLLSDLVYKSDLNESEQDAAFQAINTVSNYKRYEKIQHQLEARRKPVEHIVNPSQKQINEELNKILG